jgi:hypothetical protein
MRKILLLCFAGFALTGCAGSKANNFNARKIEQCDRILNAPDFVREALRNLNDHEVEIHKDDITTIETCKSFETISCNGIEYRLYDVCYPSRTFHYVIATEDDYL